MTSISHEPELVKGLEVLAFDQVQLEKAKDDGSHTFATIGPLSVFYLEYYERFMLQLNNWKYGLIDRLPCTISDHREFGQQVITLPGYDGTYHLRLNSLLGNPAFENLQTILKNTTKFGAAAEGMIQQPGGQSVSQGASFQEFNTSNFISVPIGETGTSTSGQMHPEFGSNLGKSDPNKKHKKGKLRKGLHKVADKLHLHHHKKQNLNMTEIRDFVAIKTTPEDMVNVQQFQRLEIEAVFVSAKEIATKVEHPHPTAVDNVKGKVEEMVEIVKEGFHELKDKITGHKTNEPMPEGSETVEKEGGHSGVRTLVKGGLAAMGANMLQIAVVSKAIDKFTGGKKEKHEGSDEHHDKGDHADHTDHPDKAHKKGLIQEIKDVIHDKKSEHQQTKEAKNAILMDKNVFDRELIPTGTGASSNLQTHSQPVMDTNHLNAVPLTTTTYIGSSPNREKLHIFDQKYLDSPLQTQLVNVPIPHNTTHIPLSQPLSQPVITSLSTLPVASQTLGSYQIATHPPVDSIPRENLSVGGFYDLYGASTHNTGTHPSHDTLTEHFLDKPHEILERASHRTPTKEVTHKPDFFDKVNNFIKKSFTPNHKSSENIESTSEQVGEGRAHSPVKKREFLRAAIPMVLGDKFKHKNPTGQGEQGTTGTAQPGIVDKVLSKLSCASDRTVVPDYPLTEETHHPTMMEKIKTQIPVIREKIGTQTTMLSGKVQSRLQAFREKGKKTDGPNTAVENEDTIYGEGLSPFEHRHIYYNEERRDVPLTNVVFEEEQHFAPIERTSMRTGEHALTGHPDIINMEKSIDRLHMRHSMRENANLGTTGTTGPNVVEAQKTIYESIAHYEA